MLNIHYYNERGARTLDCVNITDDDAQFFKRNNIKVSFEVLQGEVIVYGCPYDDESEESEVIVFDGGRGAKETLTDLANQCKVAFNVS